MTEEYSYDNSSESNTATEQYGPDSIVLKSSTPKTKKVTFNCPVLIYKQINEDKKEGLYGSITDAILTALRAHFK